MRRFVFLAFLNLKVLLGAGSHLWQVRHAQYLMTAAQLT